MQNKPYLQADPNSPCVCYTHPSAFSF